MGVPENPRLNILILTIGSRGDVQPYIALGKGLLASGHRVTIATCERFKPVIEAHGLEYGFINDDILHIIDSDEGRKLVEKTRGLFRVIMANIRLAKQVAPIQHRVVKESWQVAEQLQPDVICFHPKAILGPAIAEKLDIPGVLATPLPLLVPTGTVPCIGFPALPLGGWYNRLTYSIVHWLIRWIAGRYVRRWRKDTDTPVVARNLDLLHDKYGRNIPALHAYSDHIVPRPADWPDSSIASGYWFLGSDPDWTPPDPLVAFLEAGPPPIYVGFGSMAGRHPERLANAVIEALERTGHRGLLASGWGGLSAEHLPDNVFMIEEAPHEWLFPRVAAVVHHGGAGSTAAGLRAGKPTLICPFIADQPFWGNRVHALGAGPKPITHTKITADNLAKAFEQLIGDGNMRDVAEALGKLLQDEDGIGTAVAFIEKHATEYSKAPA